MSESRPTYYEVKNGRDGNTIRTSWADVRATSTETDESCPTHTLLPIAYSSKFRWDRGLDSTQYLIRVNYP